MMNEQNEALLQQFSDILRQEKQHLLSYACYRLGSKQDAEDALQDIFLRLHAHLDRQKDLVRVTQPQAYLFRLLSHHCTDKLASQRSLRTISLNSNSAIYNDTSEDVNEEYQRIVSLMKEIPEEQADIIRLRIYAEKSFAEIAEILNIPVSTVKSRFLYGLNKLKHKMHSFR